MALHYYGRMAFIDALLPIMRGTPAPKVLSVLSAGVHSPYPHYDTDPELRTQYSLKNAADTAGFYTDVSLDALSREAGNEKVTFVHAAPGFVATRWGTEMPWAIRMLIAAVRPLGTSPADCAEFLCDPLLSDNTPPGLLLIGPKANVVPKTSLHDAARESVWAHTRAILARGGAEPDAVKQ